MDEHSLYAARDPQGIRPLVLGRLERGWVVASETAALDIVGASLIREVERHRQAHRDRLAHYVAGAERDFAGPEASAAAAEAPLDAERELQHVVLRGGIAYERMMIDWLDDVLATLARFGPGR